MGEIADIAIVTALPDELDILLQFGGLWNRSKQLTSSGYVYSEMITPDGVRIVATCAERHNRLASERTYID